MQSYKKIIDASAIFSETDLQGRITFVNELFVQISGYTRQELEGKSHSLLNSGYHPKEYFRDLWRTIAQGRVWRGEILNKKKSGELYWVDSTIAPITDDETGKITGYASIRFEVTEKFNLLKKIEYRANHDELTGLLNRSAYMESLSSLLKCEVSSLNPLGLVVLVNVDGFRRVVHRHGREFSDKVLISIADRLRLFHPGNSNIARFNSDQFGVSLPEIRNPEDAIVYIESLTTFLNREYLIGDIPLKLSFSLGCAYILNDEQANESIVRNAVSALYAAKNEGGDKYKIFDDSQRKFFQFRKQVVSDFFEAARENRVHLFYQPKICLESNEIIGVEALIRWTNVAGNVIPPSDYLHFIEDAGHTPQLDFWVLERVMSDITSELGLMAIDSVSVNLSPSTVCSVDFPTRLSTLLDKFDLKRSNKLVIEILESAALQDINIVNKNIEICRSYGVLFSVDDFGTGYSSLNYLRSLNIDEIKIDKSFVIGMLEDAKDMQIVETIIVLAKIFQIKVTAEGVESQDHLHVLRRLGCDYAQGYYFSKAIPVNQLIGFKLR